MSFPLGQLLATPAALQVIAAAGQTPAEFVRRHASKDWGDVCQGDWKLNDQALTDGSRLFSVYHTAQGIKLYCITEADRSATTLLLADEY
jgi:hypothetical protein